MLQHRYWVAEYHPNSDLRNVVIEQGPLHAFVVRDLALAVLKVVPKLRMPDIVVEGVSLQDKYGDLRRAFKQKVVVKVVEWANAQIHRAPPVATPIGLLESFLKPEER